MVSCVFLISLVGVFGGSSILIVFFVVVWRLCRWFELFIDLEILNMNVILILLILYLVDVLM